MKNLNAISFIFILSSILLMPITASAEVVCAIDQLTGGVTCVVKGTTDGGGTLVTGGDLSTNGVSEIENRQTIDILKDQLSKTMERTRILENQINNSGMSE